MVRGEYFAGAEAQPYTQIGCSDFNLYKAWLADTDRGEGLMDERAEIGFTQVRVFGAMEGHLGRFRPPGVAGYYDWLPDFVEALSDRGLGVEWTAFADYTWMQQRAESVPYWTQLCAELADWPQVLIELVNEYDQAIRSGVHDLNLDFSRPTHNLASVSSIQNGNPDPRPPVWDYATLHPERTEDWPRKVGHNTWEDVASIYRVPGTANETCRPDQGRGPMTSDFYDAAANAAVMCAGATFHSESGKFSRLFSPDDRRCAEAWVAGAKAVPLWCQGGAYTAGHLGRYPVAWTGDDSSRAHGRIVGDRAVLSLPQMRAGYVPRGIDGWRVVEQVGSVVICER